MEYGQGTKRPQVGQLGPIRDDPEGGIVAPQLNASDGRPVSPYVARSPEPAGRRGFAIVLVAATVVALVGAACAPAGSVSSSPSHSSAPSPRPTSTGPMGPSGAGGPAARSGHQLVYEPELGLVLLLNGDQAGEEANGLVWGWDGAAWEIVDEDAPRVRSLGGTIYDPDDKTLVSYGGSTAEGCGRETWIRKDGWALFPVEPPKVCDHLALTWDAGHGVGVLFGGQSTDLTPHAETWTWDDAAWRQQVADGPSARIHHAMAEDPVRGRIVLFGGRGGSDLNDTWEWDGTSWSELTTASAPSPREGMRMAFDPVKRTVLLFGGLDGALQGLSDTWSWDGSAWTQLDVSGPTPRGHHAMAGDPVRGKVVLFGGSVQTNFGDTWEWDGAGWACVASCP